MKILAPLLILLCSQAFAHGDHHHEGETPKAAMAENPTQEAVFQRIGEAYLQRVKPIFEQKCFDCHSNQTRWPWYHSLPLVGWYLDRDVAEAREHLDFSKDYPFISHATPTEDLDAIRKEIDENDMPPFLYRLGHQGSAVQEDEEKLIFDWVDWAKQQLATVKVN